ncbi:MAG: hypothetical protein H6752_16235 [Candidatus Omnitrophica bacterium]|nr:hypothetical protein [Candidatus Omnitrophota bacterium]
MMRQDDEDIVLVPPANAKNLPKPVNFPSFTLVLWILDGFCFVVSFFISVGYVSTTESAPWYFEWMMIGSFFLGIGLTLVLLYKLFRFIRFKILDWRN